MEKDKIYFWRAIASFILVLFTMPLGHALMIMMDKNMAPEAVHYAGFAMGFVGLVHRLSLVYLLKVILVKHCGDLSEGCSSGPDG